MTVFYALALTLAAFAFIAYPLFRHKTTRTSTSEDDKFRELHSRRDTTYTMLKDLEFDYQSGILAEDDYKDLESMYKRKAISILKDADSLENGPAVETDDIEKQVQKLRKGKSAGVAGVDVEIEQKVAKMRSAPAGARRAQARFCSECGTAIGESDRFCTKCGKKLR